MDLIYSEEDFLSPQQLENLLRSLVLLDMAAIPRDEKWLRSFSKTVKQSHYHFDNGSGDHFTVLFDDAGILIKGFDHENDLNLFASEEWDDAFIKAVYQGIPQYILEYFSEEEREETTFCLWYNRASSKWVQHRQPDNDGGQGWLLSPLSYDDDAWLEWAQDCYAQDFDKTVVQEIFEGQPMTDERIKRLSKEADSEAVLEEIRETF